MHEPSFYGFPTHGAPGPEDRAGRRRPRGHQRDPHVRARRGRPRPGHGASSRRTCPAWPVEPFLTKTCLYTLTPDRDFVVDALPGAPGRARRCSAPRTRTSSRACSAGSSSSARSTARARRTRSSPGSASTARSCASREPASHLRPLSAAEPSRCAVRIGVQLRRPGPCATVRAPAAGRRRGGRPGGGPAASQPRRRTPDAPAPAPHAQAVDRRPVARAQRAAAGPRDRRRRRRARRARGRNDAGPDCVSNPWNIDARRRTTRRSSSPTTCCSTSTRTPSPAPGFADTWERSDGPVTFHIRDGMKWSDGTPATSADVCFSWGLALDADQGRVVHRLRLPRPGHQQRRRHQGRVPRRLDVHRLHRRTSRTGSSRSTCRSSPSTSGASYDLQDDRRGEVRRAARRHRAVHARRVEDRPVRAVRPQPQLLGHAGLRRRGRPAVLPRRHRHDGPGPQGGRARLRPRRQRRTSSRQLPGRPGVHGRRGRGQRLDPARVQHVRHRDRQDDRGRRPVHEGAARPGVPGRARLRGRQATPSSSACSAASATRATTDRAAGPVRLARRARQRPARSTSSSPSRSSRRRATRSTASGKRLDKEGKPITLRADLPEHRRHLLQVGAVRAGVVRASWASTSRSQSLDSDTLDRPACCRRRATRTARRTTTSSCGAGPGARIRTA